MYINVSSITRYTVCDIVKDNYITTVSLLFFICMIYSQTKSTKDFGRFNFIGQTSHETIYSLLFTRCKTFIYFHQLRYSMGKTEHQIIKNKIGTILGQCVSAQLLSLKNVNIISRICF